MCVFRFDFRIIRNPPSLENDTFVILILTMNSLYINLKMILASFCLGADYYAKGKP